MLERIAGPAATKELARLAVFGEAAEVREGGDCRAQGARASRLCRALIGMTSSSQSSTRCSR